MEEESPMDLSFLLRIIIMDELLGPAENFRVFVFDDLTIDGK